MKLLQAHELRNISGGTDYEEVPQELAPQEPEETTTAPTSNPPTVVPNYRSGGNDYETWEENQRNKIA